VNQYPDVVAKIADDYLARVKAQLRMLPAAEQEDFLKEIRSHLHEAYEQMPGEDEVARILAVLRNFGEPADVVSDRLPGAMARTGVRRSVPLYILGGILIALFGIPLGFWGFGVLLGLLCALAGLLAAYYALAGSLFLTGSLITLCGMIRLMLPDMWDRLLQLGYIRMDGPPGEFLQSLSPTDAGLVMMLFGSLFLGGAWGLFRLGKHLLRGLRFLFSLIFDWMRRFARSVRRKLGRGGLDERPVGTFAVVGDR
jgi:uncharacterized membrane protein